MSLSSAPCFTPFSQSIAGISLPERFTFPFYYQPHPLCIMAATELQQYLTEQKQWQQYFAESNNKAAAKGKMFGVLVVKNSNNDIGYLSAFSGKLADSNVHKHFVPPVFDMLEQENFFTIEQEKINAINTQIETLSQDTQFANNRFKLTQALAQSTAEITALQSEHSNARQQRKAQRAEAKTRLKESEFIVLNDQLNKESVANKNTLKALKSHWLAITTELEQAVSSHSNTIETLKNTRKIRSNTLQKQLFEQYQFLNIQGQHKDLNELFTNSPHPPPAGAGDCAAPKLLQYAFENKLTPLALAEFWWGATPTSEIRQHGNYYPACMGKCQPILAHMLQGMTIDDNPLLSNAGANKILEVLFQDDDMVIVNKPADLLSVPGKEINDSVYSRIKVLFPRATGGIIVHRLDMSTSGLMVIALNPRAHKGLQKQFINREIKKRYIAVINGSVEGTEGDISLPLRGDLYDRPRQLVCEEHGKKAETTWQLISQSNQQSRLYLSPKTGRTHQLRVHCAHISGLNAPIIGDDLYGSFSDKHSKRLHLHAQSLSLTHPITKEPMTFQCDPDF